MAPAESPVAPSVERSIGRSVPRRDAPAKVTGAALYTDDLVFPGAWHGVTVRSAEPHARLLGIDRDPDFDWSRVVILTAADIPGENVVALIAGDQPALVADEIRHVAEPVALIAAPDVVTARAALAAVRLRTEPLPPVLDPLDSDRAIARCKIVHGDVEPAGARRRSVPRYSGTQPRRALPVARAAHVDGIGHRVEDGRTIAVPVGGGSTAGR
jgi:CO/xanthine dehydrogenase Mo-binding subunit